MENEEELKISEERECGYYAGRISRESYIVSSPSISIPEQEKLLNDGFRRYANLYYIHTCRACTECTSYRIPLRDVKFSKSQRKILKLNSNLTVRMITPHSTTEKEELYLRYQYSQHFQKKLPEIFRKTEEFIPEEILDNMYSQMYSNPSSSAELETTDENGRLLSFAIFDIARESVSAVYSVYDPQEEKRSLGVLNILNGIEWSIQNGYKYFHLGLYLHGHPKMNYKNKFGPAEIRERNSGLWKPFVSTESM
ncbi:MAG: arginyltransferase [Leptospira sp.]|nr:arginyltransferase [Leptospira sp.]